MPAARRPAPLRERRLRARPRSSTSTSSSAEVLGAAARTATPIEIPYDDLIVAAGVQQSYFGHDEFAAVRARDEDARRRPRRSAAASSARSRWPRRRPTRPSAAAGSPSPWSAPGRPGSSWPGRSASSPRSRCGDQFRHIDPDEARVLLFDGGDDAAGARSARSCPAKAAQGADRAGRRAAHGLDRHRRSTPTGLDGQGTRTARSTRYEAGTVLWTAGVAAPPLADAAGQGDRRGAGPGRPDHGASRT